MNSLGNSVGSGNIQTFLARGISGIARVKMVLSGLALEKFIIGGFLKAFNGRLMCLYFWHNFQIKKTGKHLNSTIFTFY